MSNVTTKCSKNYIDCRRHPESGLASEMLAKVRVFRENSEALTLYKEAYESSPATGTKKKLPPAVEEARDTYYATLPDDRFANLMKQRTGIDGHKLTLQEFHKVSDERASLISEEKRKVEKQRFYDSPSNMDDFKTRIAGIIIEDGDFYHRSDYSWGDSRGKRDSTAKSHFQECGTYGINDYSENASWREYDTFSDTDTVGISAELSCNCGEKYKTQVYMPAMGFSDIVRRLLVD